MDTRQTIPDFIMRDTGDMMEDAFSEDTMMECSGDDASLHDLVDLTDDISHSAPTIRDAAERLLSLLGVDGVDDDVLSSEDEGVELDDDSDENDDEDGDDDGEQQNTRLLHQLAASLAQELKYSQKQGTKTITRPMTLQRVTKTNHETSRGQIDEQIQCMEVAHDIVYQDETKITKYVYQDNDQTLQYKTGTGRGFFGTSGYESNVPISPGKYRNETHLRSVCKINEELKTVVPVNSSGIEDSWAIGWDACATEAIRYLVEDEGLSPHHPTVIAMKSHLEIQRERAMTQYAM